jgi:spore coat polysaccharide biosynthesis protein SpsF (cytidylyltransferase family)
VIGIQARSTSQRLPRKVHAIVGKKRVLDLVLDAASESVNYVNTGFNGRVFSEFCLLVPTGDEIVEAFPDNFIIEGSEFDVLSRYKKMSDSLKPDYIVRITADCPLIPSHVITNIIKVGSMNNYDYVANFFEKGDKLFRLVPDGFECEFFSRKMLSWAHENATEKSDREHVTTIMRTYPEGYKYGVVIPKVPYTGKKLSIDTKDDLETISDLKSCVDEAVQKASVLFGKSSVHRY